MKQIFLYNLYKHLYDVHFAKSLNSIIPEMISSSPEWTWTGSLIVKLWSGHHQSGLVSLRIRRQILEHKVKHVILGLCSNTLILTLTFRWSFVLHLEVSDGVSDVKSGCYVRITIILTWYKKIRRSESDLFELFILESIKKWSCGLFLQFQPPLSLVFDTSYNLRLKSTTQKIRWPILEEQ